MFFGVLELQSSEGLQGFQIQVLAFQGSRVEGSRA